MSKPSTSLHLPHVTKSHTSTTCNQKLSSLTPKAHCSNFTNSELRVLSLIGSKQNTALMSPFNLSTPSGTLPRPCTLLENRPFIPPLFLPLVPVFLCSGLKGLLVPVVFFNKDTKFLPQVCGDGRQSFSPGWTLQPGINLYSRLEAPARTKGLVPALGYNQDKIFLDKII